MFVRICRSSRAEFLEPRRTEAAETPCRTVDTLPPLWIADVEAVAALYGDKLCLVRRLGPRSPHMELLRLEYYRTSMQDINMMFCYRGCYGALRRYIGTQSALCGETELLNSEFLSLGGETPKHQRYKT